MEETREQQQMYNMFRSYIYLILIVEIVMNLPITSDNRMIAFVLDVFHRFKVFDSVATCKVMELICITVTCIGTKAHKSLKWNLKTMVLYPVHRQRPRKGAGHRLAQRSYPQPPRNPYQQQGQPAREHHRR